MGIFNFKNKIRKLADKSSCEAPFSSIRFEHSGNAIPCCYNRGNILGKFPEQTIEEIWFGENIKRLRKSLANNDYSLGCQNCEFYLQCNNREASGMAQYDYLRKFEQKKDYPAMMDFELGTTCNFECIMCSGEYSSTIRKNREGKSAYYSPYEDHKEEFIKQLVPFMPHLKEMRFTGGEPFMMKIHYDIWEKVVEVNPNIVINVTSNGSILHKRVRNILKKGNFKVSLSIDSLVKETYESIRVNGVFEEVMANARFFQEITEKNGHVMNYNVCFMRQNWKEFPQYFEYCNEHSIKVVIHTVEFPAHCSVWNLPSQEIKEISEYISQYSFNLNDSNWILKDNANTYEALKRQLKGMFEKAKQYEENEKTPQGQILGKLQVKLSRLKHYPNYDNNKDYLKEIQAIASQFDEKGQLAIYTYLDKFDLRNLIDEFNISTEERIYERFKLVTTHSDTI